MAIQKVDITVPGGDTPRSANIKINNNFDFVGNELKRLSDNLAPTVNDIGIMGELGAGVSVTDALPTGMRPLVGTNVRGHDNYGNYAYSDGSIMVYVAAFCYRWGHPDSPHYAKYGVNSCDVKPFSYFGSVAAANAAGYAVHRAFYDDGKLKAGFFVDKFMCSNNAGKASSIKNGIAMSASTANAPFSGLTGSPANNFAGAIDAAKTRGPDFFPTTIFIQRALSLLSMAHAQAATSSTACAWYDAAGVTNYPKGCNNNALRDANDTSVIYTTSGYSNAGLTGSGQPFAKTTHNGQACGVADLNGNMNEICLGLTQTDGNFYVLKTTAKASALTSGVTLDTDAWGTAAMTASYDSLGASYGELSGESRNFAIGSTSSQVFSSASSGLAWAASCAGIPQLGGGVGTNAFGNDRFYDNRVEHLCPAVGGTWNASSTAGVWIVLCIASRTYSTNTYGLRSALYFV